MLLWEKATVISIDLRGVAILYAKGEKINYFIQKDARSFPSGPYRTILQESVGFTLAEFRGSTTTRDPFSTVGRVTQAFLESLYHLLNYCHRFRSLPLYCIAYRGPLSRYESGFKSNWAIRVGMTWVWLQTSQHLPSIIGWALCPPSQTTSLVFGWRNGSMWPSQMQHLRSFKLTTFVIFLPP